MIGFGGSNTEQCRNGWTAVSSVYVRTLGGGETFVSDNFVYWPASAHVREAEEPPRKPTGVMAGKLPVPGTLRAGIVHRDLKPASLVVHAPRMRRPHQRGQGPA